MPVRSRLRAPSPLGGGFLLAICLSFSVGTAVLAADAGSLHSQNSASAPILISPTAPSSSSDIGALKEFFYNLITERDRQYTQRFDAQEKAVVAALAATERAVAAAFAAQEKATASAFAAAKEAVAKAENAAEKRFDSVNEFRGQLKDQQSLFVQKSENDVKFKALVERIDAIDARLIASNANITSILGRGEGASQLWLVLAGALGLLISVVAVIFAVRRSRE